MGRLTKRREDGSAYIENGLRGMLGVAVDKLADLEDAEENGMIVHLPCKVGDTVWCVIDRTSHNTLFICEGVYKCTIRNFEVSKYGLFANITISRAREFHLEPDVYELYIKAETIFRTREAAEAALKERSNENRTD